MSVAITALLEDFSLEMTGKDVKGLREAQSLLPAATRVNITFLGNESLAMRTAAAKAVKAAGLTPVPHISARRIASTHSLHEFLGVLRSHGAAEHVFAVGGDPEEPEGPFPDALALITSAALGDSGLQTISISGYPEGHPDIPTPALWDALDRKASAIATLGKSGDIVTQFGFDVDPVVDWIERVRARGIDLPIRVGVPGPAGAKRLLSYARRFGVASTAGIARKYGLSLANLAGTAGPDRFITELADRLNPDHHGVVHLHFYTFGGLEATAEWVRGFAASAPHLGELASGARVSVL